MLMLVLEGPDPTVLIIDLVVVVLNLTIAALAVVGLTLTPAMSELCPAMAALVLISPMPTPVASASLLFLT